MAATPETPQDAGYTWANQRHGQRDGAARSRSVFVDDVRHPGGLCHAVRAGDVVWNTGGAGGLIYATALSYSELARLYRGAGSSHLCAEQSFLNTTEANRFNGRST
jgi:hypothetical protein